jgi:uncharacterized membrane protein YgdD (TMEM256/DUF423 family)
VVAFPYEEAESTDGIVTIGALLAASGVALGALGAHAWRTRLDTADRRRSFETAVHYQLWHALAMLAVAVLVRDGLLPAGAGIAAWLFLGGVALFSGSLYVLAFRTLGRWAVVTPIGGLLLLAGWIVVAVH